VDAVQGEPERCAGRRAGPPARGTPRRRRPAPPPTAPPAARSVPRGPSLASSELWLAYALSLPILFVHELGHAATCARHGAPIGPIGIALYVIYPALYCDVTAAWRLPRWQRFAVDLGGLYFQAIATAGVALAWRATGSTTLYGITVMSIGLAITNLIPFFSLDGYWALSDALGVVNLRSQRRRVVAGLWARAIRTRDVPAWPWPAATTAVVIAYSLVALVFAGYAIAHLAPRTAALIAASPGHVVELGRALASGELLAAAVAAGRVAGAALAAILALALARRLVHAGFALAARRTPA
jgi:putative peptide zinc metalloprotease protein